MIEYEKALALKAWDGTVPYLVTSGSSSMWLNVPGATSLTSQQAVSVSGGQGS